MPRRVLVALGLVGLLALTYWLAAGSGGEHPVSGILEADQIRLGSRVGGRVAAVHVAEGERVSAGTALLELEPFDFLERRAGMQAALAEREAELARLEAGHRPEEIAQAVHRRDRLQAVLARAENGPLPHEIEAARARLESARATLALSELERARAASLAESGTLSQDEVDRKNTAVEAAGASVIVAEQELALLEDGTRPEVIAEARALLLEAEAALRLVEAGFRAEDVAAARARVQAAGAALEAVEREIEELTVRAPVDGVVEALDLRPGDLVAAGAPVLSLLDASRLWVRAYVPQGRLALTLGAPARVVPDGLAGESFRGRVTFLASRAEFTPGNVQTSDERARQVFRVKVSLEEGLDRLRPGMTADVVFEGE